MKIALNKAASVALIVSLGLATGACQTSSTKNTSLDSIRQPVVTRSNLTLDLAANSTGLSVPEKSRLVEWFKSLNLGYGDRVSIDDVMASAAVRDDVASLTGRFGLLLGDGAPVTPGYVNPGMVRVVVTRSSATVPGCPDWSEQTASYGENATSSGFGCAVNGNLAAMVADPEHLIRGATSDGGTVLMSSTKAINSYREAKPSGAAGLPQVSSQEGGN